MSTEIPSQTTRLHLVTVQATTPTGRTVREWYGVRASASRKRPHKLVARGTCEAHALAGCARWIEAQHPAVSQIELGAKPYDRGILRHDLVDLGEVPDLGSVRRAVKQALKTGTIVCPPA